MDCAMTEQSAPSQKTTKPAKKLSVAMAIFSLISMFIGAVFVGLVINCILWAYYGYDKTITSLNEVYLTQVKSMLITNQQVSSWYVDFLANLYNLTNNGQATAMHYFEHSIATFTTNRGIQVDHGQLHDNIQMVGGFLQKLKNITVMTINVIAAKFLGVLGSTLFVFFALMLGVVDGLLRRYIRTSEGGRESSFLYSTYQMWLIPIPIFIVTLYLSIPLEVDTELVMIGVALTTFFLSYTYCKSIKKFV
jgi:hypothetical protein